MKEIFQNRINDLKDIIDNKKKEHQSLIELYENKNTPEANLCIEVIKKQLPLQILVLETKIKIQKVAIEYDEKFKNL